VARGIAESVAGTGVTVNSVLPGPTESEGVGGFVEAMAKQQNKSKQVIEKEFFEHVRPSSLLKRFATVDEVAAMVTYVASELSSATNESEADESNLCIGLIEFCSCHVNDVISSPSGYRVAS
jgi:NAD(P)-dependent dehydrogenase (short-subunit alcohol dehydrogenase family)